MTEDKVTELLTAAQMRAIEQAAIESGQVTGLELMERAGKGVVEALLAHWPNLKTGPGRTDTGERLRRAVIACGPGNNGGDGFVIARLLAELDWDILISLYGNPESLPPDARASYDRWLPHGEVICLSDYDSPHSWFADATALPNNIFVDALFGTGMTRPVEPDLVPLVGYIAEKRRGSFSQIVAVDVPTGLHSDTGVILGHNSDDEALMEMRDTGRSFMGFRAIPADLTVTFHRARQGHVRGHGPWMCGTLVIRDIGL
ncbi:MAG: NAD(P)H-hydrate epimerase [Pseudomonadota bacterium]